MATPQPPYPQPGFAPPPPQGNGMAVAGLVCGILGMVLFFASIFGWILALLGIIFGAIGLSKAKKVGGKGKGMAMAGLICGVVGLVAGIVLQVVVISAFTDYMKKGKKTEASLNLNRIEKSIKMYSIEHGTLPPSAQNMPGEPGSACTSASGKLGPAPRSQWAADPGWAAMDFAIDEPTLYSYSWTASGSRGVVHAVGDLDCDGTLSTWELRIELVDGNVRATYTDPTPD